ATRPPITEPLPRPAARDAAATALPAVTASLARGVSGSELPAISSRSSLRTRRAGGGRPRGVGLSLSRALRTPEPRHRGGTDVAARTVPLPPCDTVPSPASADVCGP